MTISELEALVRRGESDSVEFKKSTGQLTRAAETLCAFLNGPSVPRLMRQLSWSYLQSRARIEIKLEDQRNLFGFLHGFAHRRT